MKIKFLSLFIFFLFILFSNPSYALIAKAVDLLNGATEKTESAKLAVQFAELIQIQKKMEIKLKKLNRLSESISKHTHIRLRTTEEAYRFLTDETFQKRKIMDGLMNQKWVKDNPELETALKKLSRGQDLSPSDISGLLEVAILDEESDAMIIRRLQRNGYDMVQINIILKKIQEVKLNQLALLKIQESIISTKKKIEKNRYLLSEAEKKNRSSKTDKERNQSQEAIAKRELLIQGDYQGLYDQKKERNKLVDKQNRLIRELSYYKIAFRFESEKKEKTKEISLSLYKMRQEKAEKAKSRIREFVEYTKHHFGGKY